MVQSVPFKGLGLLTENSVCEEPFWTVSEGSSGGGSTQCFL